MNKQLIDLTTKLKSLATEAKKAFKSFAVNTASGFLFTIQCFANGVVDKAAKLNINLMKNGDK